MKGATQSVSHATLRFALGDLNGDQVNDAAISTGSENVRGTGEFRFSCRLVASQGGEFNQVGSALIDDRPIIQSLDH